MTSLVQDAICTETSVPPNNFANTRIIPEVLQEMVMDLDEREIISVIFLMTEKDTDFSKVIQEVKEDPISAFTKLSSKNAWADKLLESLIVIGNKHVIWRMNYSPKEIRDMEHFFVTRQHNVSPFLNKAIKSLYFLCENLDDKEVEKLVGDVNSKLSEPLDINDNRLYLELYILEWLRQGYISIDPDNVNLSNLLKNLKSIGYLLDLPFHFDDWENYNRNEQDSQVYPLLQNNPSVSQNSSCEYSLISSDSNVMWSSPGHKKLCFIINNIDFINKKQYPTRYGSELDEKSLEKTLKDRGFDIDSRRNLEKQDMIGLLNSLSQREKSYSTYGAIFICILSHGFEGEVVFSDDESLSIAVMKEKFCCRKLQKVFKFLILQSCQGKQIGLVERKEKYLVSDGPSNSTNPLLHLHFVQFQATINDFAAMRDKKQGSWFIQDLCQEIEEGKKPIEIRELIRNVKTKVANRCAPSDDGFQNIVQLPVSTDTIIIPYFIF